MSACVFPLLSWSVSCTGGRAHGMVHSEMNMAANASPINEVSPASDGALVLFV